MPLAGRVDVLRETRAPERCAYCHDALEPEPFTCARCGTAFHAECASDLTRCPTLGCRSATTERAPSRPRRTPLASWAIVTLAVAAAFAVYVLVLDYDAKGFRGGAAAVAPPPPLVVAPLVAAPPGPPPPTKADLDRAAEKQKRDALEASLSGISAPVLADMAAEALDSGDDALASFVADRAIEHDKTLARAWRVRGEARLGAGDVTGAIEDLEKSLDLDDASARAWCSCAVARGRAGDAAGSIADATRAIERDETLGRAWEVRADGYTMIGNDLGARSDEKTARSLAAGRGAPRPTAGR
jgi:Tfp pilus assembly protein PilF